MSDAGPDAFLGVNRRAKNRDFGAREGSRAKKNVFQVASMNEHERTGLGLPIREVARLLNVHHKTVRRWIKLGYLGAFRASGPMENRARTSPGRIMVFAQTLNEFVKRRWL